MKRTLALLVAFAIAVIAAAPRTQQTIPIRSLGPAVQSLPLGSIAAVRPLPDGRVVVNERGRRLIIFDSTLATFTTLSDTAPGAPNRYPTGVAAMLGYAMIPYLADTILITDYESRSLLVLEPSGRIGRTMAPPKPQDFTLLSSPGSSSAVAADAQGRLVYRTQPPRVLPPPNPDGSRPPLPPPADSAIIVRADFETRTVDTIGRIKQITSIGAPVMGIGPDGKRTARRTMNPVLPMVDEWAVLTDGSVAFVRGYDYHIDWLYPDGSRASTPKMPYDWRRLTDADKQAKIDSAKRMMDSMSAAGTNVNRMFSTTTGPDGRVRMDTIIMTIDYVSIDAISDYVPPIRPGAVRADADGNLWILPTTTLGATGGGLLYDVVNRKGELFERVQLPKDRFLMGFGRGGIVYMMVRDPIVLPAPTTPPTPIRYVLERARVIRNPVTSQ